MAFLIDPGYFPLGTECSRQKTFPSQSAATPLNGFALWHMTNALLCSVLIVSAGLIS